MSSRRILPGYWFSRNPDKAWAEKFYLGFIPFWFVYNLMMQKMGWLDTGNFWNITQNLLMWLPYCVAVDTPRQSSSPRAEKTVIAGAA